MNFIDLINLKLSLLVVIGQIVIAFLLVSMFLKKEPNNIINFFSKNALFFSFIITLGATLFSLFYSEIAGYEPCKLCWFQRIFMYPQVIILGMALWKKNREVADYAITLSIIGAIIAGYHYLLGFGLVPNIPCSAISQTVSCSQNFVTNFGYITIPLMSFTGFLLIIVLLVTQKFYGKNIKSI